MERKKERIFVIIAKEHIEGIKENLLDTSKKAPKAWSSIWGCGQGISNINEIVETKTLIHKLARDFNVYYKH